MYTYKEETSIFVWEKGIRKDKASLPATRASLRAHVIAPLGTYKSERKRPPLKSTIREATIMEKSGGEVYHTASEVGEDCTGHAYRTKLSWYFSNSPI